MRWLIHLVAVWVLATTAAQSSAAETIVTNGKLLGATGVLVNGSSYDVSFVDGTCAALFSGCDQITDFVFQDSAAARAASQALLDQVFLGIYDTNPELTSGCASTSACTAFTPFFISGDSATVAQALNRSGAQSDSVPNNTVQHRLTNTGSGMSGHGNFTYAVWTVQAVPEPSTWLMMILGFGMVGYSLRRSNPQRLAPALS
jgi:hypothetical protein